MRQLPEMSGRVFTDDIPMPDPPKQGFLKGASSLLFGGGPKIVDREELFGESAGKPGSGVAKHVTGPSMAPVMAQSAQGTSEVSYYFNCKTYKLRGICRKWNSYIKWDSKNCVFIDCVVYVGCVGFLGGRSRRFNEISGLRGIFLVAGCVD